MNPTNNDTPIIEVEPAIETQVVTAEITNKPAIIEEPNCIIETRPNGGTATIYN